MNEQSLLKDLNALGGLSAVIPLIMSGFAFAYVVGYFLAFDLAWFPFFSLSEHIVFAIRALPIAVAGMLVLLVAIEFPQWQKRAMWVWIWILVLIVAAAFALVWRYPGLVLTFLATAMITYIRHRRSKTNGTSATVPYLVGQLMILSMIIGFCSGKSWWIDRYYIEPLVGNSYSLSRTMHVHSKSEDGNADSGTGHLIFVGSVGILFYDYETGLSFYRWEKVETLHEPRDD
jgi:hypothetical protein